MPLKKTEVDPTLYSPRDLSQADRNKFRDLSRKSAAAKARSLSGEGEASIHPINKPIFKPLKLMPKLPSNGFKALSLFSGGGGLDLSYERAGFTHVASYEWLEEAAGTLSKSRPDWRIYGGEMEGDVRNVDWREYQKKIDVLHGGPPCQPFSTAGRQKGKKDPRDMIPEFVRAVLEVQPKVFQMENVPALTQSKFSKYIEETLIAPLSNLYEITMSLHHVADFGVPQQRKRIFFVGTLKSKNLTYQEPAATHTWDHLSNKPKHNELSLFQDRRRKTLGARRALGLPDIGIDRLAPTIRSTLNGPRNTTSINSSSAAERSWEKIGIWPNGVAANRSNAQSFPAKDDRFRLSVPDVALLQGFPASWKFQGPTYMKLGQIGNAVPPPLGYAVAAQIAKSLG